jgi:hypothetical protein
MDPIHLPIITLHIGPLAPERPISLCIYFTLPAIRDVVPAGILEGSVPLKAHEGETETNPTQVGEDLVA